MSKLRIPIIIVAILVFAAAVLAVNKYNLSKATRDWIAYTDMSTKISFKYPANLGTQYIRLLDWPPKLQVLSEKFSCTEGGSEIQRAGQTQKENIGGNDYCVTRESEGAAGSIYTMYAYAFPYKNQTAILTFSTQSPQCPNYPEPQMSECEKERAGFNVSPTINLIAQTLTK